MGVGAKMFVPVEVEGGLLFAGASMSYAWVPSAALVATCFRCML